MLSYSMFRLEKFYKESFLSMQPKDLCINCEKINLIQTIISIQINNKIFECAGITGMIRWF